MSAVTPLRQVMSKSIQKAFAEHGLPAASTAVRGSSAAFQRKKMFDTTSSPGLRDGGGAMIHQSPAPPALDLRLSPAVRRSNSESEESLQLQISAEQQLLQRNDLPNMRRKILLSAQKLTTESIVITRTEHMSSVSSSSSSGNGSNGSINSVKPHTSSSTNSSYQSAGSNSSSGSVFKSCRSVEIITATTEQIQQIQSVDEETNAICNPIPPITPITRIPGAVIHKKLIKFETPKIGSRDSRESQHSPCDIFFTPNATPIGKGSLARGGMSPDIRTRKNLVKQNLSGRFSPPRRPSIKECAHSTAFSRIENITDTFDANDYDDNDIEDEVFAPEEPINQPLRKTEEPTKGKNNQSGIWSIMSSVMRLPSRKGSTTNSNCSPQNESAVLTDANSNSIIKRCASIAGKFFVRLLMGVLTNTYTSIYILLGSLVRPKPLVSENELSSLKRKRTFTTSEQSTSSYLAQLHNSDATSPNSDSFNTSTKRFRIQGRRPIDRMRMNS